MGAGASGAAVSGFGSILETAGKYLGRPKKRKYLPPSQAEYEAWARARQSLMEGRGMYEGGASQYNQLAPSLYEAAGFEPIMDTSFAEEKTKADAEHQRLIEEYYGAKGEIAKIKRGGVQGSEKKALKLQKKSAKQARKALPAAEGLSGYYATKPTVTGFKKKASTAEEQSRQRILDKASGKVEAGLMGNLPDDPRLIRQFAEGEKQLRNQLQAQLGPGYELSTAGQNALANFQQRKAEAFNDAQRADVGAYGSFLNQRQTTLGNLGAQQVGLGSGIASGAAQLGSGFLNFAQGFQASANPFTQERYTQMGINDYNATVPSDWAAGLMVSGQGHKEVGAALGASSLGGGGGGGGGGGSSSGQLYQNLGGGGGGMYAPQQGQYADLYQDLGSRPLQYYSR